MNDLDDLLTPLLAEHDVPSLAAAVVFRNELHAAGAVGVRKRGDETPVTVNDKYHVGSCTKAMTATLAGVLAEQGLISWDSSLKSVFPELTIHSDYEPVTLKQLLSHTSGMPAFTNPDEEDEKLFELFEIYTGSAMDARLGIVMPAILGLEPIVPPGKQYVYSNMGYITAGAMLEQLTQTSFETLLEREYFAPLGLDSGGFGAAGMTGQIDEPWGHVPEPVEPAAEADNPIIFSPAGRVHMSVLDFAKSAMFHLSGKPGLVSSETLELLHTPVLENYALGWGVFEREWAEGKVLTHAGSNGRSFAVNLLAPKLGFAVVVVSNSATEEVRETIDQTVQLLKKTFLGV